MLMSGASTAAVLSRLSWLPVFAVVLGGLFALSAPWFYVRHRRGKRFERFEQNFPDALDSLGRAMRAGHAFSAALELVATESVAPVSAELRKTLEEWRLGQSWDEALEHLAGRVPLASVRLFVASVRVQSKAGGKLHEILGRISESLREAASLEGEIRSISAHGRLTGLILMVIPAGIAVILQWSSPGHLDILREHPVGRTMIGGAIGALIAAHFVIQRILDIEV
jgi:tight adherence protein B